MILYVVISFILSWICLVSANLISIYGIKNRLGEEANPIMELFFRKLGHNRVAVIYLFVMGLFFISYYILINKTVGSITIISIATVCLSICICDLYNDILVVFLRKKGIIWMKWIYG